MARGELEVGCVFSPLASRLSQLSDKISKPFFHAAKLSNAEPEEEGSDSEAGEKTGPVDDGLTQDTPAKAIDHPDNGIQRIQQTPFLRDDGTAEPDRGHVQAELHKKGDDVPKVAVFDIQGRDPKTRTKAGKERKQHKKW